MERNRFVVQEHTTAEGVHWDLMLEEGEVLITFRLEEQPGEALRHSIGATRIFDHPLRFLTYEGPVQQGTGQVRIVDAGTYHCGDRGRDRWALTLSGGILKGGFALVRTRGDAWQLSPEKSKDHP